MVSSQQDNKKRQRRREERGVYPYGFLVVLPQPEQLNALR